MRYTFALLLLVSSIAQAAEGPLKGWWNGRQVTYKVVDGLAITEGDILLGTAEEMAASRPPAIKERTNEASGLSGSFGLWANGVIPYTIKSDVPNRNLVLEAIRHWNEKTPIRLVERTTESNYVRFEKAEDLCVSYVGNIRRGAQRIGLDSGCDLGAVIHEIGHAAGLFHEQGRIDRDGYVQILTENIGPDEVDQFDQSLDSSQDLGPYDYGSIMHYDSLAFTRNYRLTIQTIPSGIPIGQRDGLSQLDVDAIRVLYKASRDETIITSFPEGLTVVVDGAEHVTPAAFRWADGTEHTISAPANATSDDTRHLFARWTDGGEATHTIKASAENRVHSAIYMRQYKIALTARDGGGRLSVSPIAPDGFVSHGTTLEVTAIPDPGHNFVRWRGFGFFSQHGSSPNPLRFVVDDSFYRYDAVFHNGPVTTVTTNPPGLEIALKDAEGETVDTFTSPKNFAWAAGSEHTVEVTDLQPEHADGASKFSFKGWEGGTAGAASMTVKANEGAQTFTASYDARHKVIVRADPVTNSVSLSPTSPDRYYDHGTTLHLTPNAGSQFTFAGWTGDLRGGSNPGALVVDESKIVGATFGVARQITPGGVVNAASYRGPGIAPGSMVTIFGTSFGPGDLTHLRLNPATDRLETVLADTRVLFDGVPAPLVYVAPGQIAAIVPYSVAQKTSTSVQIEHAGTRNMAVPVPVLPATPGLFTLNQAGSGQAAALNQNWSANGPANPAPRGTVVMLWATGEGVTTPASQDGKIARGSTAKPVLPVKAYLGGREIPVQYAGAAPDMTAGIMQVNVYIPDDAPTGEQSIVITVGNYASAPGVTIVVQ